MNRSVEKTIIRYIYQGIIFFLIISGFAQMPIFKRYYIADIPGLEWLAKFFVTHYMHYLFAAFLIGLATYILGDYLLSGVKSVKGSFQTFFKGTVLLGIIITGILLVIKNRSGSDFSPQFIIILDLAHMGLVMLLIASGVYSMVRKRIMAKIKA